MALVHEVFSSRRGGVEYSLASGPAGMNINSGGVLTWRVPALVSETKVDVIVSIKDTSGLSIYEAFTITAQ